MKDVQATLRRIDEEITGHHQQIARHRVEIARLQETRLVLMGIAEGDAAAHERASQERVHTINGAHARPVLIVRKEGSGEAEAERHAKELERKKKYRDAKRAAKAKRQEVKAAAEPASPAIKKGPKSGPKTGRTPRASASALWRPKVLQTLRGEAEGMTRQQLGDVFGLPRGEKHRKALSNALYTLANHGQLRHDNGRFILKDGDHDQATAR